MIQFRHQVIALLLHDGQALAAQGPMVFRHIGPPDLFAEVIHL